MEQTPVAVVIPAYNAAETLAETLQSVLNQTHTNLDIVVVDDGSTDDTRAIAESFAARDARVRVISQVNGGVARARNAGIAATTAEFVAPLDADDLWHPQKIARQLEVISDFGPGMGFVYTGFRRVDESGYSDGKTYTKGPNEGWIYLRHILFNLVGNGSSLLIRRAALDAVGGYDPGLRDRGIEGAEDWLLELRIARRWQVGLVPDCLVGYRKRPGSMSNDRLRMAQSAIACIEAAATEYPDTPGWIVASSLARLQTTVFLRSLIKAQLRGAWFALLKGMRDAPGTMSICLLNKAITWPARRLCSMISRCFGGQRVKKSFFSLDPLDGGIRRPDLLLRYQLRSVTPLEGPPER